MADTQVTSFTALTGGNLAVGDLFPVIDISAAGALKNSIITSAELIVGLKALGSFAALTANTFTGQQIISTAGAADTPPLTLTGAVFTGGTATTTKPQLLVEPSGTTSTNWLTTGTMLGVNAPSGFAGALYDFQHNNTSVSRAVWDGTTCSFKLKNATYLLVYDFYTSLYVGGAEGLRIDNTSSAQIGTNSLAGGSSFGSKDVYLKRKAAATWQIGLDANGTTNQHLTAASQITADGAGANFTISGGNGRGGAGGSLIFSTYTTAAAATIGALTTRLTLDTAGLLTFADAVDMAFNATTGTKIGTATGQKIGFWNATPVVQQVLATGGGATVDNVISLLQTLGLCKQS